MGSRFGPILGVCFQSSVFIPGTHSLLVFCVGDPWKFKTYVIWGHGGRVPSRMKSGGN